MGDMSLEFYWLAVAVVTVISASRITRVVTFDAFPPARWVRDTYADLMDRSGPTRGWALLLFCPWCFSPWATLGVILWGYFSGFDTLWWIINGSLAASYLAAIFMTQDGDDSGESENEEVA